ncbi:MAG: RluA family pseudouridine synthase [Leptospira sp.]|nr:RluA family pseudouridine synthase [Leptospira sp.]
MEERFTYLPRNEWFKLLQSGAIEVNGFIAKQDQLITDQDTIGITLDEDLSREPPINDDWKILYEDESLFIVDKPPDIPIHPAGRYKNNTLLSLMEKTYPEIKFHTCHRLDRETSGVVIFAKNERASSIISKQFQKKSIYKEYLVWVLGDFPERLHAKGYLVGDETSQLRKKVSYTETQPDSEKISEVETSFEKINFKNGISLIRAIPITGKTHQIRATCFSLGYPLLGDKMYGSDETVFLDFIKAGWNENLAKKIGHHRQALHCSKISFVHPDTGLDFEIISPIPHDLLMFR